MKMWYIPYYALPFLVRVRLARQQQGKENAEHREEDKPDNKTPLGRIVGALVLVLDGCAALRTAGAAVRHRATAVGADHIIHGESLVG